MNGKCPVDGSTLEQYTVESIEVEKCPKCLGLWFTKDEIRQAEEAEGVDENWMGFDLWADQEAFTAEKSTRKCPVCSQDMASILYAHTGVKVDYCLDEHGIWLDPGEFEGIIDALRDELLSKSLPEYISLSLEEAKEIFTGDKGPIQEWRDFKIVYRLLKYRILVDNPKLMNLLVALGKTPF
jgi:Zn-finger nucleic acid-binding protein